MLSGAGWIAVTRWVGIRSTKALYDCWSVMAQCMLPSTKAATPLHDSAICIGPVADSAGCTGGGGVFVAALTGDLAEQDRENNEKHKQIAILDFIIISSMKPLRNKISGDV